MAKNSKTNLRKRRQAERAQAAPPEGVSRRRLIGLGALGLVGVGAATAGGFAGVGMYTQYIREHDLTQIGQGKPAVVQVHDPQCPTCTALQRQTRRALRQFGECDLLYLVADINLPEGQMFARRHSVGNVTLVLLDGKGEMVQVLAGLRQRSALEPIFAAHVAAHGMAGA